MDSEILFQYLCFPKGDKHVLGFLFRSVSGPGAGGCLHPMSCGTGRQCNGGTPGGGYKQKENFSLKRRDMLSKQ